MASFYPSTAATLIRQASCNQALKGVSTSHLCLIYLFKFISDYASLFFSPLKHLRWGLQVHQTGNITCNVFSVEIKIFYFGFLLKGKTQDAESSPVTVLWIFHTHLEQNWHMYVAHLKMFCIFFAFTLARNLDSHKFSSPSKTVQWY